MRRFNAPSTALLVSIAVSALAGCGLIPQPDSTPVNQYNIAPTAATANVNAATCGLVVEMREVAASAPWTSNNMLYMQGKHDIDSYAYNRWAATPATMLGHSLVGALEQSDLYRGALAPTNPGRPDLILSVNLRRGPLQVFPPQSSGDKSEPASSREELALSATLTEADSGKLVAGKRFSGTESAAPNPYGGVKAANALAGRLIEQLLGWLAETNAGIQACSAR